MFKLEFKTDNAAFEDDYAVETARILKEIAERIERRRHTGGWAFDVNGNTVGEWSLD
jgi:hypothetical protein